MTDKTKPKDMTEQKQNTNLPANVLKALIFAESTVNSLEEQEERKLAS